MKYSLALLSLAASVMAVPQAASSVTAAPSAPVPSGVSPAVSCALACNAGDVTCQAACLGNARPNASQAIDTNKCAAQCDQGDGSPAAASAYARCVDGCIYSLFPSSQTAFAPGNAAASASNAVASGSAVSRASASAGSSPTGTGSQQTGTVASTGATAQKTGAASANSVQIAGAGLAGLMAIFAL